MNLLNIFTNNRRNKSFQGKTGERNRAALRALRGLGFSLPKVRKVLISLNDVKPSNIAGQEDGIYASLRQAAGDEFK